MGFSFMFLLILLVGWSLRTMIHILYNKRKRTFKTQTFITRHPKVLCFRLRKWSTGVMITLDSIKIKLHKTLEEKI